MGGLKASTEALFARYAAAHAFAAGLEPALREAVGLMARAFQGGGKLLLCGNGGSSAQADHIVGELVKPFRLSRPLPRAIRDALTTPALREKLQGGLPAVSLSAHAALVTAMINDVGGEYVFAQQVAAYGRAGDVLLGISTSGNSRDVLYAAETARAMGLATVALTGRGGGRMKGLFDLCIAAPSDVTEDIQDMHSTIGHILCAALECEFWGE